MWSSRLWKKLQWLLQRVRDCKPYVARHGWSRLATKQYFTSSDESKFWYTAKVT